MSELEKRVEQYSELSKDKSIDVAGLMINALQQETNNLSSKAKRWAYLVSVGLPPFGLIFVVWFWFTDKDDAKTTAIVCLILTIISFAVSVLLFNLILSGSGASVEQIETISPEDIKSLIN